MSIRRLADSDVVGLEDDCDQRDEDPTRDLVLALRDLFDSVSRQLRGGPAAVSREIERWEGDGYLYVETSLTDSTLSDIDISIQGGRAVIRMAR